MKKKFSILLVVALVLICTFAILAITTSAEEREITISYVNTQDPTNTTTSLDKVAYTDGKQIVKVGETFTLPTTANSTFAGQEGYQLVWYTENGRTYKAGESVSFTEDTRLYRCIAKEAYTADELQQGVSGDTRAAILMADVERTAKLNFHGRCQTVVILNGYNLSFNGNFDGLGAERTGRHIIGSGKLTLNNPNEKKGSYHVFDSKSHGYDGGQNKSTVGIDVTIDAPNYHLYIDWQGDYNVDGYPLVRIYGKVNVYTLGRVAGSGDRSPRIEIFDSANVTVTGPYIFEDSNTQKLNLTIYGGEFNLPETAVNTSFWTNDIHDDNVHTFNTNALSSGNRDVITITGGTFNVKISDIALTQEGKKLAYDEATEKYSIVDVACTNGTHNYKKSEAYKGLENNCTNIGIYYYRCDCGEFAVKTEAELGHSYTIVTVEQEATADTTGVKRVTCDRCGDNYTYEYSFSPLDVEINITVLENGEEKNVTLLASDVFTIDISDTASGYTAKITGFVYDKNSIVKLSIPSGVTNITEGVITDMSALKEVVLVARANVTLSSKAFKNCPLLEKLTVLDSTPVFSSNVVLNCPNFATIDMTNGNAIFENNAFLNNSAIKSILMGSDYSYSFGANSFSNSGLTQIVFPDDSNIQFNGDAAFYGCPNLTYAYFGKNCISDKKINKKPFDCCYSLETVVLMDIVYINEYVFCCNGNASSTASHREGRGLNKGALNIYSHSDTISVNANTFANRGILGVNFYSLANITSLSNCAYTIYAGLPHAYSLETIVPSTCVTQGTAGYVTSCPCGVDYRTNTYTTYSTHDTSLNEVENEAYGTDITYLPLSEEHTDSDIVNNVVFENGYLNFGKKSFKCLYCDETIGTEEEASFPALFSFNGYSMPEDGDYAITVGYSVNVEAVEQYETITGKTLEYGVVCAIAEKLNGKAPLDESLEGVPVIKASIDKKFASFDFVLSGFSAEQLDLAVVMSAYVTDNDKTVYLQEAQVEIPESISINKYITDNAPVIPQE